MWLFELTNDNKIRIRNTLHDTIEFYHEKYPDLHTAIQFKKQR